MRQPARAASGWSARRCCAPTCAPGPEPAIRSFASAPDENAWLVSSFSACTHRATAFEEMAVLCRTNARLADFEETLHDAAVPFQGSSLLGRDAARRLLRCWNGWRRSTSPRRCADSPRRPGC